MVNNSLLLLALQLIKMPNLIIDLCTDLFTDRINSIIRESELCAPYTVDQGIDQGEVISPSFGSFTTIPYLLNSTDMSLRNLPSTNIKNIYNPIDKNFTSLNISIIGYLDDTTWLASNWHDLEKNLN